MRGFLGLDAKIEKAFRQVHVICNKGVTEEQNLLSQFLRILSFRTAVRVDAIKFDMRILNPHVMKRIQIIASKLKFFAVLVLLGGNFSCSDEVLEIDTWDVSELEQVGPEFAEEPSIGAYYQGGIVIALDSSGEHGLIAAVEDQSTTDPWWNGEFVETLARSAQDGGDNTQKIISAQGSNGSYAASLCAKYEIDGYDDWFLPSKDELQLLYENRELFEGSVNDLPTPLTEGLYWSSTEYEIGTAWVQDFTTGEQHLDNTSDEANVHTRAVRKF